MKILVFAQIFLYLFLAPALMYFFEGAELYRFDISVVMAFLFTVGCFFIPFAKAVYPVYGNFEKSTENKGAIYSYYNIPSTTKTIMFIYSLLYVYITLINGLFDRRQGSEVMALIYANMPLYQLLLVRIYEVIFYPFVILLLYETRWTGKFISKPLMIVMLLAFLCFGVLGSRSKLLMPVVFYLMFFYFPKKPIYAAKPLLFKIIGLFLVLGVIAVVLARMGGFNDLYSYFIVDFMKRLDGLELISLLAKQESISFFGSYDLMIFSNFVASIPFLEKAAELKAAGLTSSKSYLLQVVLGLDKIDINNSIVTDLFYLGGYPLLALGGALYGFLVYKFDSLLQCDKWFRGRLILAAVMSFGINALRIEQDFSGIIITFTRDFFILVIFLVGVSFKRKSSYVRSHENLPVFCCKRQMPV